MLAKHPRERIKVHAVWYRIYPNDARQRWRADLLPDTRVRHWWDEFRMAGRQMPNELLAFDAQRSAGSRPFDDDVLWDAFVVFDPDAQWEGMMPRPRAWGHTILSARAALAAAVSALVDEKRRESTKRGGTR